MLRIARGVAGCGVGPQRMRLTGGSPAASAAIWRRTSASTASGIVVTCPPTCGESTTPGRFQSGCPGGSGSGSVTSSAARSRPAASSATRAGGVDDRSAPDVHEDRAVGQRREHSGIDETAGRVVERERDDEGVGGGQEVREVSGRDDVAAVVAAGRAADAREAASEGREPVGEGVPESARPENHDPQPEEPAGEAAAPLLGAALVDEPRQVALGGEQQGDPEFGSRTLVHARRVREPHARREPLEHAVEPDALTLHEADLEPGERVEQAGRAHVRRDDDVDPLPRRRVGQLPDATSAASASRARSSSVGTVTRIPLPSTAPGYRGRIPWRRG